MAQKSIILFTIIAFLFLSCSKTIDKKREQAIIDIMANGRWIIYQFTDNNIDITSQFKNYEFQFYETRTVDAFTSGLTKTGTWEGNISEVTVTTNFKEANDTLMLLNEVWKIKDSSRDYVKANTTNGTKFLYLKKKQ